MCTFVDVNCEVCRVPFHSLIRCLFGDRRHGCAVLSRRGMVPISAFSYQISAGVDFRSPRERVAVGVRAQSVSTEHRLLFPKDLLYLRCLDILVCVSTCGEKKEEMVWCGFVGKVFTSALFLTGEL